MRACGPFPRRQRSGAARGAGLLPGAPRPAAAAPGAQAARGAAAEPQGPPRGPALRAPPFCARPPAGTRGWRRLGDRRGFIRAAVCLVGHREKSQVLPGSGERAHGLSGGRFPARRWGCRQDLSVPVVFYQHVLIVPTTSLFPGAFPFVCLV